MESSEDYEIMNDPKIQAVNQSTQMSEEEKQKKVEQLARAIRAVLALNKMKTDSTPILIVDGLYLGSIGAALSKKKLQESQITHIMCVADKISPLFPAEFIYKNYSILDSPDQNILAILDETSDYIEQVINSQGNRILVHCFAGKSRSASVVMAYLIKYKNMTLLEAFKHTRSKRILVMPNTGFMQQLKKFECQIKGNQFTEQNAEIEKLLEEEKQT